MVIRVEHGPPHLSTMANGLCLLWYHQQLRVVAPSTNENPADGLPGLFWWHNRSRTAWPWNVWLTATKCSWLTRPAQGCRSYRGSSPSSCPLSAAVDGQHGEITNLTARSSSADCGGERQPQHSYCLPGECCRQVPWGGRSCQVVYN